MGRTGTPERIPGLGFSFTRSLDRLGQRPGRAFLLLFAFSFSIQGFFLTKVPQGQIRPNTNWELPAIAVSLAERGAFADPYALPTGPTAHLAPIPPTIFGLSYRLFGLNLLGGYVGWLVNMTVSAAVWGMLPWLAGAVGLGGGVGVLAGFVGAMIPKWAGHGENLAALAMGLLMVAFLRRWRSGRGSGGGAFLLGIGSGVAFHAQPALLPVVLGWMAFELWWRKDRGRWLHSGLLILGIVVACLPWGWRNYRAFDAVFFIRSNLGLELRMGNHEGVAATFDIMDRRGEQYIHPRALESEARKVQEVGEVKYMRDAGREALDWMWENPGESAKLTASRIAHWWLGPLDHPPGAFLVTLLTLLSGVGVWLAFPSMAVPDRWAILIPLLTFPLIHYVVAYMPRYREPIDWIF
ncbi:MAG: hypothetical protein MUO50_14045, partial [Longimicrobiales bacterium]|nr:hypothetical protein [Longimicrobiales bacterium]